MKKLSWLGGPTVILAGRVAVMGMALVSGPIVARSIGPEGRGVATAAIAVFSIAPAVIGAGLPMAVRRRAALAETGSAIHAARRVAALLMLPAVLAGLLFQRLAHPGVPRVLALLLVAGVAVAPATVAMLCDHSVLVATDRHRAVAAIEVLPPSVNLTAALLGGALQAITVEWVLGASILSALAGWVAGLVLVRPPRVQEHHVASTSLWRESFAYGGGQLATVAGSRLDQAIMVAVIGSREAGFYAIAALIAGIPVALGHTIGFTVFRRVAASAASARRAALRLGLGSAAALGTLATVLLALATPWAVPMLFGAEFSGSVVPTLVALAGTPALVVGSVATVCLGAVGRGLAMTWAQVSGLAVGIGLLFAIGPALGALGAALASSVGFALTGVVALVSLQVRAKDVLPSVEATRQAVRLLVKGMEP